MNRRELNKEIKKNKVERKLERMKKKEELRSILKEVSYKHHREVVEMIMADILQNRNNYLIYSTYDLFGEYLRNVEIDRFDVYMTEAEYSYFIADTLYENIKRIMRSKGYYVLNHYYNPKVKGGHVQTKLLITWSLWDYINEILNQIGGFLELFDN